MRIGRVRRTVLLVAGLLLVAGVLTGCAGDPARAVTVLHRVARAVVTDSAGHASPAREGAALPAGDGVRTGAGGAATLVTGGRALLLGPDSTVTVFDGTSAELVRGSVLLDRRSGPALSVTVGDFTVETDGRTVARVERGYATRVAVFAAVAGLSSASGRGLSVRALHQATMSGRGLPASTSPLALVGDRWDELAAPGLVGYDRTLNQVAAGLDKTTSGTRLAGAVPAAYVLRGVTPRAADPPSEAALALVLAKTSGRKVSEQVRYQQVRVLREDGGSWGVVAELVDAPSSRFGGVLARLLSEQVPTTGTLIAAGAGSGSGDNLVQVGRARILHAAPPQTRPPQTRPPPTRPPPGTPPPSSVNPPVSPPQGGPLEPITAPLARLVTMVLDLLPLPLTNAPATSTHPQPLLPAVTGVVTGTVGALAGN